MKNIEKVKKEIKSKLLAEKEELSQQSIQQSAISKEDTVDSIDFANAEVDQKVVSLLAYKTQRRIKEIDKALERVESVGFGCCEECDAEIGEKRLKANPHAVLCIDCQEDLEKEELKFRAG